MKYKVLVDDNFHYMDESHRYNLGEYKTMEKAIEACKDIVDEFLREYYEPGMSSSELLSQYALYGEDPFIIGEDEKAPFSARDYASERAEDICNI
jgi:hypothetical protein